MSGFIDKYFRNVFFSISKDFDWPYNGASVIFQIVYSLTTRAWFENDKL